MVNVLSIQLLVKFWNDEDAQTTTEYILLLALIVIILSKFKETFVGFLKGLLDTLGSRADKLTKDEEGT